MFRAGEPPVKGARYTYRHGVYALLPRDGKLLITYQHAPFFEFQLPGGGVDPGESPVAALHREVMEETGWSVAAPRRVGAFRRFVYMPEYDLWAQKLCTIYVARPVRQLSDPTEAAHTAIWIDPETAIAKLDNDGDRTFAVNWANWIK